MLLDLDHPERVIAELPGTLLAPDGAERDGYVPSIVYSCGGLLHAGRLRLPYGMSDSRVGLVTATLVSVLDALVHRHDRAQQAGRRCHSE